MCKIWQKACRVMEWLGRKRRYSSWILRVLVSIWAVGSGERMGQADRARESTCQNRIRGEAAYQQGGWIRTDRAIVL